MEVREGRVRAQMGYHSWGPRGTGKNTGCPACAGRVPTATHNLEVYCEVHGMEELLGEWADRSRRPKDFTPGSAVKVPWQCRECGLGWDEAHIYDRTCSSRPRLRVPGVGGACGDVHQQPRGVVRTERAGGPAGGVGAPRQGADGLHAGVSREGAADVRGVRMGVGFNQRTYSDMR